MRSFEGQFSDNRPLKRTREEKVRLLAELKETLRSLKPHTAPELRTSIGGRIKELEADLAAPPPPPRSMRAMRARSAASRAGRSIAGPWSESGRGMFVHFMFWYSGGGGQAF